MGVWGYGGMYGGMGVWIVDRELWIVGRPPQSHQRSTKNEEPKHGYPRRKLTQAGERAGTLRRQGYGGQAPKPWNLWNRGTQEPRNRGLWVVGRGSPRSTKHEERKHETTNPTNQ
jgi:hypothetical protein